jgi:uncharacterized protein involved in exopolysaccharide biosynthesis
MMLEGAPGVADRDDQIDLRQWLRIVLKRKWTILVIFVVSAFFSVVMTYLAPPVYRASTTIQIERNVPRLLDYKELTPTVDDDYNADFYQTNYELLKSRAVAERAAEEMGLRKRSDASDNVDPPVVAPEPAAGSAWQELLQHLRRGSTPVPVEPSASKDNAVVAAFQGSLTVEPVRKSRLVRLHFDSTDPYFAARAVNTVAQAFININLERRFEASSYAKTFLEEKLLQTKAKLEESETCCSSRGISRWSTWTRSRTPTCTTSRNTAARSPRPSRTASKPRSSSSRRRKIPSRSRLPRRTRTSST